ncbi:hypothetical protein VQH23_13680 [Pararoseomonas sp. SCSIO 73927]|uniref:hypothetical protein n=1 Tax=Pararoseomonas sp. SCSIO 73927 TaxID=3114537 RepID=UPI0030CB95A9
MIRLLSAPPPDPRVALTPPVLPTAPRSAATIQTDPGGMRASRKTKAAVADIAEHLYPAMRCTEWWCDEEQARCVWSSATAAELLRRRGLRARVVYGACLVVLLDADGKPIWRAGNLGLGLPDPRIDHPGLHAMVEIADANGPLLLDLNLWQTQRPRFPEMPDGALVGKDLDRRIDAYPAYRVSGVLPRDAHGYRVHLLTVPSRPWKRGDYGDLQHGRATKVADIVEVRIRAAWNAQAA